MSKIDLDKIIRNVAEDLNKILSLSKKIEIEIINKKDKKFFLYIVLERIEQVIANLLDNAISFSQIIIKY